MAAPQPTTGPQPARAFGDLTSKIDALRDAAIELVEAYEGDAQVIGLADRANDISGQANALATALYGISEALGSL